MSARAKPAEPRTYVTRDQAAAAADATPWTPSPDAIRTIDVHFTGRVTGCEGLPLNSDGRWRTLWWKTPRAALRTILIFLGLRPEQVRLRDLETPACVEIHDGEPDGAAHLMAMVFGVQPDALRAALAALLKPEGNPA